MIAVDYVFANMCLHKKGMGRILKPRGKLVIKDLDEHHDRWMGFKREDIRKWFKEMGIKEIGVGCAGENCCAQSCGGGEYASVSIFIFIALGQKRCFYQIFHGLLKKLLI